MTNGPSLLSREVKKTEHLVSSPSEVVLSPLSAFIDNIKKIQTKTLEVIIESTVLFFGCVYVVYTEAWLANMGRHKWILSGFSYN